MTRVVHAGQRIARADSWGVGGVSVILALAASLVPPALEIKT